MFNVVRQQQCDIDKKLEEAGPLERKREKVLKNIDKKAFLDVLMGGTKSIAIEKSEDEKKEESYEQDSNKNVRLFLKTRKMEKLISFFFRMRKFGVC